MLDKTYQPKEVEEKIYKTWEEGKYFTPRVSSGQAPHKKPFTIILPLPNANDPMHMGHALFTVQDIMVRYHRMLGDPTLWLPGADHAGIETQFVFEKHLAKENKSRFDFDRKTLYQMIWEFVEKNREINKNQLKRVGFSLDWTRYHYSLEPEIVNRVLETFRKLHRDGYVYRGERIVNFCTKCGTSFSDLEVKYIERKDPLFYIKYGPFVLATTRPETKFGDTAVCFHPGDKRYKKFLGQEIEVVGVNGPFKVKVIEDQEIDPDFGTGIEKVTPGHDFMDYEISQRHNLPVKKVIDLNGRLNDLAGRFKGMKIAAARTAIVQEMKKMGLIDHIDENYVHNVATCYRCGTTIEPMVIPQWFIKTKPLAAPAMEAVKKGQTKIVPKKRFEKMYFDWLKNIRDWNISRQIVWGPRIPVWYCPDCNPDIEINFLDKEKHRISDKFKNIKNKFSFGEITEGLQSLIVPQDASYQLKDEKCIRCQGNKLLQETDTFDTWFLSGQWPVNTLKSKPGDFEYFYPTSVLDTLWDILFFWVARMMMFGLYLTKEVPFKVVHLHARVIDKHGQKMSKSKGNVINPILMVDQYGADALRLALIMGVAPASDISLSEEKIRGMRNFCNKLWNIGRFIELQTNPTTENKLSAEDKNMQKKTEALVKKVNKYIEKYNFGRASEELYQFAWHEFADKYLEYAKTRLGNKATLETLNSTFSTLLKLLHPFIPFVTEELWQQLKYSTTPLIIEKWPVYAKKQI